MNTSRRLSMCAAALALALGAAPASAADATDLSVLARAARDLGLSLLDRPVDPAVRVPLGAGGLGLLGRVEPYASLGPRLVAPPSDAPAGLATPVREPYDDLARGVGVGAGVNWRLTDRLELFGEYQLFSVGGRGALPESGAASRRELDTSGLKGGLSIRF